MGTVYIGTSLIGSFSPDVDGTSGNVLIDSTNVGSFTLALSGYVYLDSTTIGTYWAYPTEPPTPPEPIPLSDARERTKVFLEAYLANELIVDDDDNPVVFAVVYEYPPYPLELEFKAATNPVDVLFLVGCPVAEPQVVHTRYEEAVPITIWCIDKPGITGTKLKWKAEKELRRVAELFPWGSFRSLDRIEDNDQRMGSTTFYSTKLILRYRRTVK